LLLENINYRVAQTGLGLLYYEGLELSVTLDEWLNQEFGGYGICLAGICPPSYAKFPVCGLEDIEVVRIKVLVEVKALGWRG